MSNMEDKTIQYLKQNRDFKIQLVEDKETLKQWNYDEPVVQIYNSVTSFLIPCSRLCFNNLKREIEISSLKTDEYIKLVERYVKS